MRLETSFRMGVPHHQTRISKELWKPYTRATLSQAILFRGDRMQEKYEFRVSEKYAATLFQPDEGQRLSDTVRKVTVSRRDPRFLEIGKIQKRLVEDENESFFGGGTLSVPILAKK
jgi:hypothetical protein